MIYGIDVSHHQQAEEIDWFLLKEAHAIKFCYIRASYGTRVDAEALEHAEGCRAAGIAVGFYHFYRHHQPAEAQLETFLDVADPGAADLLPVLDLEKNRYDPPVIQPTAYRAGALGMVTELHHVFGGAVFYASPAFIDELGLLSLIGSQPLWLAHWGWEPFESPYPKRYDVHQYGTRKLKGSPYELDANAASVEGYERIKTAGPHEPCEPSKPSVREVIRKLSSTLRNTADELDDLVETHDEVAEIIRKAPKK